MLELHALRLTPAYHERVWGGQRLRPATPPIGEGWIVHEDDRVANGPHAGRSLAELTAEFGEALLGRVPLARTGERFPLLIKLLDTADWLSVQVHPNDRQAAQLAGPGHFGKTEAWHILEAAPDAAILCGLLPGTNHAMLADAIRNGTVVALARRLAVAAGDSIFIAAGTIHALGPGLLLYEVQQTSDITYRVYDWDRPQSAGRALHIEQSLAVSDPERGGEVIPPSAVPQSSATLVSCPYFTLDALSATTAAPLDLDTHGDSFHALTAIEGQARIVGVGWVETLDRFETAIIPATCGPYQIQAATGSKLLRSRVV